MPRKSAPVDDKPKAEPVVEKPKAKEEPKGKGGKPLSRSAQIAARAKAVIAKATDQKPVKPSFSTLPHVPSGSTVIDYLIGGSPTEDGKGMTCPGYPRRKITEIYGPESSGKTTLALAAIAAAQARGEVCMFLDFEHALHHGYARKIGVSFDEDKMLFFQPNTLEEGFKMLYIGLKTGVDLAVIDSVAAMVPANELAKPLGDAAKVGARAAAMSEILPKMCIWLSKPLEDDPKHAGMAVILLNQERALIQSGGHGPPPVNTSGGKALKFFAYVRLQIQRIRSDIIEKTSPFTGKKRKIPIGNLVSVKVVKDKTDARQGHGGEVFIRYGQGLDDTLSIIEAAAARKIIKKNGSWLEFEGSRYTKKTLRDLMMSNQGVYDRLKQAVYNALLQDGGGIIPDEDIEEDAILSDMRKDIGDEDVFAVPDESESESEEVVSEDDVEGGVEDEVVGSAEGMSLEEN